MTNMNEDAPQQNNMPYWEKREVERTERIEEYKNILSGTTEDKFKDILLDILKMEDLVRDSRSERLEGDRPRVWNDLNEIRAKYNLSQLEYPKPMFNSGM